jgi:hypothetical protein
MDEAPMLTQVDVEFLLREARRFYKGQLKSSNKKYVDSSTEKRWRRNENAAEAKGEIEDTRIDHWYEGRQYLEYGRRLMQGDLPVAGNCGEMAAVTACSVSLAAQNYGYDQFAIHVGSVGDEFHAFVLLVNANAAYPEGALSTVTNMANNHDSMGGVFILDAWTNCACLAQDYGMAVRAKLRTWEQQGKYIEIESGTSPAGPLDPELWWQTLMTQSIKYELQARL